MSQVAQFVVDNSTPETGRRIDKIVRSLTQLSVRQTQGLFDAEGIKLNDQVCKEPWKWLVPGDRVEVQFDPSRTYRATLKPRKYAGFELVYEDAHLLVVNKQANVLTVPTEKGETDTLMHRLGDYLARRRRYRPKVWVVHRLDRGVSGLLVVGKRPEVATALRAQLAEHKPLRRYLAIVSGRMTEDAGTFDTWLATQETLTRISTDDPEQGERAITHFRSVERRGDVTLVELRLETGKRHQIRVQLAEAGHPVLGDQRYRPQQARHRLWEAKRLALAAVELGFEHPVSGEAVQFQVTLPREMQDFLARLS